MAAHGVTDVCLTPHLRGEPARQARRPEPTTAAFAALDAAAPPLPRLHRGAEVMLDRPLARGRRRSSGASPSAAPGTSWSSSPAWWRSTPSTIALSRVVEAG